jgi:hypothetical protein
MPKKRKHKRSHYGRTQKGAARRVKMKHIILKAGVNVKPDIPNKKLVKLYRRITGKAPPRY